MKINLSVALTLLGLVAGTTCLQAQTTVKGRVMNENKEPLPSITVSSGNSKAQTDEQGRFSIYIDRPGRFHISFTGLGFAARGR